MEFNIIKENIIIKLVNAIHASSIHEHTDLELKVFVNNYLNDDLLSEYIEQNLIIVNNEDVIITSYVELKTALVIYEFKNYIINKDFIIKMKEINAKLGGAYENIHVIDKLVYLKFNDLPKQTRIYCNRVMESKAKRYKIESELRAYRSYAFNKITREGYNINTFFSCYNIGLKNNLHIPEICADWISRYRFYSNKFAKNDFNIGKKVIESLNSYQRLDIDDIVSILVDNADIHDESSISYCSRKLLANQPEVYCPYSKAGLIRVKRTYAKSKLEFKVMNNKVVINRSKVRGAIKNTSYLKAYNYLPIKLKTSRLKVSYGDKDLIKFLRENPRYINKLNKKNIFNCMIQPDWKTCQSQTSLMAESQNKGRLSIELLNMAFDKLIKVIKIPEINELPHISDIYAEPVNPSANPGVISSIIFKGQHKKHCYTISTIIAGIIFDKLKTAPVVNTSCWSIGGREKQFYFDKGKIPLTRHVYMPESYSSQIGQVISRPITRAIKILQVKTEKFNLALGYNYFNGGWGKINERFMSNSKVARYSDWSKYDSHIRDEVIVRAFSILRSCYQSNSILIDNCFMYTCNAFINKNLITPDGILYKLTNGLPSGDPFTSLVGTMCNLIIQVALSIELGIEIEDIMTAGDDTILMYKNDQGKLLNEKEIAWNTMGMLMDEPKSGNFGYIREGDDKPNFLQVYSHYGLPARELNVIIERVMLQKRGIFKYENTIDRLEAIVSTGVYNPEVIEFYSDFLKFLLQERGVSDDIIFNEQYIMDKTNESLIRMYSKFFEPIPLFAYSERNFEVYTSKNTYNEHNMQDIRKYAKYIK